MKFTKFALASAAAFGLAGVALADDPEPSSFQGVADGLDTWYDNAIAPTTGYNVNGGLGTTDAVWFGGSSADDTKVKAYSDEDSPAPYSGAQPGGMSTGSNFLKVSNSDPLWRMITPYDQVDNAWPTTFPNQEDTNVEVGEGLFVDTLVQFTPSEDVPTVEEGSKLIVWMDSNSNLCVTAAKLIVSGDDAGTYETAHFATAKTLEVNTWYRLTVKAYGDLVDDGSGVSFRHGFEVYIDGRAVSSASAAVDTEDPDFEDVAVFAGSAALEADFKAGKLFLSLDDGQTATLAAVGFKGEGLVDDIVVTDTDPFPQTEPTGGIDFTLTWSAGVSAVWYAIDDGDFQQATKGEEVHLADGETVEVQADPEAWYAIDAASIPTAFADGATYTITATAAATAGAAGVNDTALASWTPDQVKAAFGDTVTPAAVNGAAKPYLDYQFGQDLGTVKGDPELVITDIVQNGANWDIKVQVLAKQSADSDDKTALAIDPGAGAENPKLAAALKIKASDTLAGVDAAEAAVKTVVFDSTTTDLTVTVSAADGAFFKAAIDYVGAPSTQQQGGGEQGGEE